jgi:hypothetical protein
MQAATELQEPLTRAADPCSSLFCLHAYMQAATELREVEAVVVPLISHADTDQSACRNFCFAVYQLSLVSVWLRRSVLRWNPDLS